MKRLSATLIGSASSAFVAAAVIAYPAWTQTARPSPDPVEAHAAAGKNAAGGRDDTPDFYGLVTAICVAPLNGPARPDAPAPRENPIAKKPIWSRYRPLMIFTGWELRARRAGF